MLHPHPKALYIFCLLTTSSAFAESNAPPPLTEAQAADIVEAQIVAQRVAEAERRQRILEVVSLSDTNIRRGAKLTKLRRVKPLSPEVAKPVEQKEADNSVLFDPSLLDYHHENISLFSTVYDDQFTEVIWRDQVGRPFTVWTNVNFKYLRTIHSYQQDSVYYSYLGMTCEIRTDAYITHPVTGEQIRTHTLPDWMPDAGDFPAEPAYLVLVEEAGDDVPAALYRQMDALLSHYSEHETELKAAYQRSEALRKARVEYLKKHPQPEKDIVINYWPIRSNSDH